MRIITSCLLSLALAASITSCKRPAMSTEPASPSVVTPDPVPLPPPVAIADSSNPTAVDESLVKPALPATSSIANARTELQEILGSVSTTGVRFSYDQSVLPDDAKEGLARVAEVLRKQSALKIRIEGNCDERGSDAYNNRLGLLRAQAIKAYLKELDVADDQVVAVSNGESRPVAHGHEETAWSQNRRVDVVIVEEESSEAL